MHDNSSSWKKIQKTKTKKVVYIGIKNNNTYLGVINTYKPVFIFFNLITILDMTLISFKTQSFHLNIIIFLHIKKKFLVKNGL